MRELNAKILQPFLFSLYLKIFHNLCITFSNFLQMALILIYEQPCMGKEIVALCLTKAFKEPESKEMVEIMDMSLLFIYIGFKLYQFKTLLFLLGIILWQQAYASFYKFELKKCAWKCKNTQFTPHLSFNSGFQTKIKPKTNNAMLS